MIKKYKNENMTNISKWPFKEGSYEYYFDEYFDIPEGIADDKYTNEEAHKYATEMTEQQIQTKRIDIFGLIQ